ncbi:hypothetical protein LUW77_03315 [Streptomyces radiopugnans]|nr:hypothetical protein LUW77_03315 [Streptomyces radiopugnans]
MDVDEKFEHRLWTLIDEPGERMPLLSANEARAAMELLRLLSLGDGVGSDVARQIASEIARRLPAEE